MTTGYRVQAVVRLFTLAFVSSGCVIRYGEKEPPAAAPAADLPVRPVDFGPVERQLASLIDQSTEVDARDRLEQAWTLAQSMEDADPKAQHIVRTYLEEMVAIEARAAPAGTSGQTRTLGGGFGGAVSVDSEELAGPEPIRKVENRPAVSMLDPMALEGEPDGEGESIEPPPDEGPNVTLLLADAVRLLEGRKPEKAMEVLDACRELPCWADVSDAWEKARDTMVFTQKEGLAVRFLELRQETDVEARRAGLLALQEALSTLRAAWPESAHAADIEQHMARVQRELESLSEAE